MTEPPPPPSSDPGPDGRPPPPARDDVPSTGHTGAADQKEPRDDAGSSDATPATASGTAAWKVATALTAVLAVALSGTVYLLMDRRVGDLEEELQATRQQQAQEQESDGSSGDLGDLLGDLGDMEGLDDLGGLLGDSLGGMDPILAECLAAGGFNLGGEGSIPDGDMAEQVRAIREIVADERGLRTEEELDIEFVSADEVQRRAVELAEDELDRETAEVQSRLLAALGAVEPDLDLAQAQLDALDAGVGGFYNTETGELVIGSAEMDGMGTYITSHEMVHALADATIGLPDTAEMAESEGADAAYAALNAVEGDATLYGQLFISAHLPVDELLALNARSAETRVDLSGLPHVVRRELEFPYIEGMTFTCDVFLNGGWDAVDETYTDLPTTTAQILFPDRYRSGEAAAEVRTPAGPAGWDELQSDTFGAADLLFLLEAPGGDRSRALEGPKELVRGWAGGRATVWDRDGETAVALILAEHDDGPPLCQTMIEYYDAAFPESTRSTNTTDDATATDDASGGADPGDDTTGAAFEGAAQSAVIACADDEVALGIGPDIGAARAAIS